MKTEYRIWAKPTPHATYKPGELYPDLDAAKDATGLPASVPWNTNGEGNHWPEDTGELLFVGAELVPESPKDRASLAEGLILECGQIDGDHHKAWVLDQVLRVLTGNRYEQIVADYCAGENGPETYAWDEGIAP